MFLARIILDRNVNLILFCGTHITEWWHCLKNNSKSISYFIVLSFIGRHIHQYWTSTTSYYLPIYHVVHLSSRLLFLKLCNGHILAMSWLWKDHLGINPMNAVQTDSQLVSSDYCLFRAKCNGKMQTCSVAHCSVKHLPIYCIFE